MRALVLLMFLSAAVPARAADVLVTVDGEKITSDDVAFEMLIAGVPEAARDTVRKRYLDALVEAKLLERFLRSRKVEASEQAVALRVLRIRTLLSAGDRDVDEVLKELGFDDESLAAKLAVPVAWDEYSQSVVRPAEVRAYWEKYRSRFDGTRLRARQILLKVPRDAADDDPAVQSAFEKLAAVKKEVEGLERDFGAAARELSEAPSAKDNGDVGRFPFRGRMPVSFTEHVFGKMVGETTEPFRSPFGVHLAQVTEVVPGDYSLEDVRDEVFDALADEVRAKLIEQEREKATIEWADETAAP